MRRGSVGLGTLREGEVALPQTGPLRGGYAASVGAAGVDGPPAGVVGAPRIAPVGGQRPAPAGRRSPPPAPPP